MLNSWSFRTTIYQKVGATFWMYLEWKSSLVTPLLVFKRVFSQSFFNTNHPYRGHLIHFPWAALIGIFPDDAHHPVQILHGDMPSMMNRFLFGSSGMVHPPGGGHWDFGHDRNVFHVTKKWSSWCFAPFLIMWLLNCQKLTAKLKAAATHQKWPLPLMSSYRVFFTLNNPKLFFIISAVEMAIYLEGIAHFWDNPPKIAKI